MGGGGGQKGRAKIRDLNQRLEARNVPRKIKKLHQRAKFSSAKCPKMAQKAPSLIFFSIFRKTNAFGNIHNETAIDSENMGKHVTKYAKSF